jgi:hypothetical protein
VLASVVLIGTEAKLVVVLEWWKRRWGSAFTVVNFRTLQPDVRTVNALRMDRAVITWLTADIKGETMGSASKAMDGIT